MQSFCYEEKFDLKKKRTRVRPCVEDDSLFELPHHQSDHVRADWRSISSHKFEKHVSVTSFAIRKKMLTGKNNWKYNEEKKKKKCVALYDGGGERYDDHSFTNTCSSWQRNIWTSSLATRREIWRWVASNILLTYYILLRYSVSLQVPYDADFQLHTFNLGVH